MPLSIDNLTTESLDGTGVFDVLMRTVNGHVNEEFTKNRIRGPEYSQVYLGALQSTLDRSLQFLLNKDKADLEAQLIQAQINKMQQEVLLVHAQVELAEVEKARVEAQTAQILAQQDNLEAEKLRIEAQTTQIGQQTSNMIAEAVNIPKQGLILDAQKCKLDAEFDLLTQSKLKAIEETALMAQKNLTEKAQILAAGVDADSLVGRQKNLYEAQTDGFRRNAEQQAAKLMMNSWTARKTTDPGQTDVNADNRLQDTDIGAVITKLLQGIGAA